MPQTRSGQDNAARERARKLAVKARDEHCAMLERWGHPPPSEEQKRRWWPLAYTNQE